MGSGNQNEIPMLVCQVQTEVASRTPDPLLMPALLHLIGSSFCSDFPKFHYVHKVFPPMEISLPKFVQTQVLKTYTPPKYINNTRNAIAL